MRTDGTLVGSDFGPDERLRNAFLPEPVFEPAELFAKVSLCMVGRDRDHVAGRFPDLR